MPSPFTLDQLIEPWKLDTSIPLGRCAMARPDPMATAKTIRSKILHTNGRGDFTCVHTMEHSLKAGRITGILSCNRPRGNGCNHHLMDFSLISSYKSVF